MARRNPPVDQSMSMLRTALTELARSAKYEAGEMILALIRSSAELSIRSGLEWREEGLDRYGSVPERSEHEAWPQHRDRALTLDCVVLVSLLEAECTPARNGLRLFFYDDSAGIAWYEIGCRAPHVAAE